VIIEQSASVLGISFDGLAISGVVNEFLNVASVFRDDGYRILFDLGGDIVDRDERLRDPSFIPSWVKCISAVGGTLPAAYGPTLVDEATRSVVGGVPIASVPQYMDVCRSLANSLVATLDGHNVRILIVENGTLPDNPIFTEAIYLAIEQYGARHRMGRFVLWRDHDLMWSTEPHLYGDYPYDGVRRPKPNRYIQYCVATEWMRRRLEAWARDVSCEVVSNRFDVTGLANGTPAPSLRETYGIPTDAYLIARCTRVVPPKTIERDLRLMPVLRRRLEQSNDPRPVYLFVTGPTNEEPDEYRRLRHIAESLDIERHVVWGDGLRPFQYTLGAADRSSRFSVRDLLAEADLSSFLTSYDYEGFGNPPGEAMAMGVPFIATSYELYDEVYGRRGAIAPLLPIRRDTPADERPPDDFVESVARILSDRDHREQVIARNTAVCRRFFSLAALREQVHEIFGPSSLPPASTTASRSRPAP
jgi:glycosyltransferase involved in cell wall biosynthesis